MFAITTSLRDHQRQRRRQPALSVTVAASRFSLPTYPFTRENTSADADAPNDAAIGVVSSVAYIVQVRNDAGALDYSTSFGGSWTNLDTVTAGQGLALRFDPVNEVFGVAYGDGTAVKFRSSTDHTGTAWNAATTLATEASAIGSIALAFDDIGDACVFYTLGTGTTLKRLRRTSGTWAGSGTNWSRSGSVASITGLSAAWNADYFLAVTGTEVTTTHERLWAVAMGDTSLPTNAWSSLKAIAEADAAADLSFAYPHVCMVNGFLFATFQQIEAGDVAASRVMFTSVNSDGQVLSTWREPFPAPYMENATYDPVLYGAPLAYDTTYDQLYLLAPGVLITANRGDGTQEFSELVTACSWRETPTGFKATLTLDFSAGFTYTPQLLRVGNDLLIQHGMVSSTDDPPEPEYGTTLLLNISRIVSRVEPGKTTLTVEADGPWEQLARFRAPQAWTAPAAQTRGDIFQRVAGRAGLVVTLASGDRAPSDAWTTDTPEFAIAAGESAAQTLRRLLEPTDDFLRLSASGGFEICGIAATDSDEADGAFVFPMSDAYVDDYSHILSFERFDERRPNWHRAVGPDRYADTFLHDLGSVAAAEPWTSDPVLAITRDLSADDDSKATAAAERGFHRRFAVQPRAQLITPLQSAIELYDVLFVGIDAALPDETTPWTSLNGPYRVIGRGVDFRRGPATGAPVYHSVLELGFAAILD